MEVAEEKPQKAEPFQVDPMGSMIQNEISAIKDASIAAAKEKMDEWTPWAWAVENLYPNKLRENRLRQWKTTTSAIFFKGLTIY